MFDRASTFADPEIVALLRTRFVPVALDQAYQRRQEDAEGEFYRKIAGQGPRDDFRATTQGFYVATATGELLLYNNNRDPAKLRRLLQAALRRFEERDPEPVEGAPLADVARDPRWNPRRRDDVVVVRVHGKVLGGYEPTDDPWRLIQQQALSRDNLWILRDEVEALAKGAFPAALARRIARFHLVDATRGEPPMWTEAEVAQLDVRLAEGRLSGAVRLRTETGDRAYDARWLGRIATAEGALVRFDLVVLGSFRGEGRYTRGAPAGEFPLALAFSLADGSDVADDVPPQGSRGWVAGYLR